MTECTSPRLRQTLAYTVMAKDDGMYYSGAQADPSFTVRAKDDHSYFFGAQADPSLHY